MDKAQLVQVLQASCYLSQIEPVRSKTKLMLPLKANHQLDHNRTSTSAGSRSRLLDRLQISSGLTSDKDYSCMLLTEDLFTDPQSPLFGGSTVLPKMPSP